VTSARAHGGAERGLRKKKLDDDGEPRQHFDGARSAAVAKKKKGQKEAGERRACVLLPLSSSPYL